MPATTSTVPTTRIRADTRWPDSPFRELWERRDLIYLLARRDVQLRYQHTVAGMGWTVAQPLATVSVLTVFQMLMGQPSSSGTPYPLYAIAALVPWTFLIHALTQSSNSLLKYFGVINKVYFPRLTLPLAAVLGASVDFLVALPLVPLAMLYFRVPPRLNILLLPVFALHVIALATALGIWLAALNTRYRDTANALPVVTQLWFFLTPIAYSTNVIPQKWHMLAGLNPMLGVLEGFRWSLFGTAHSYLLTWLAMSWLTTIVLLGTGVLFFLAGEETLTDLL